MKIAIDATPLAHGSRAVRRHSKNLIETLIRIDRSNSYKLLYIDRRRQRNRYAKLLNNESVSEYIIPIPARALQAAWKHLHFPRSEWLLGEFDVLYATELYFPPAKSGIILGSVRGIAYYVIENKIDPTIANHLKNGLRYTLKYSDYFLAVSQKTKQELIERLSIAKDRIYVVSHGVDPKFKKLQDRDALFSRLYKKLGFNEPYILFVGAIGHHKNVMGILEAYSICHDRGIDIPLVMAGPEGSAWEEANNWVVKKGLDKYVNFIGSVGQDDGEMTDLYNGASLFVFPSFYEGWTAPPLEAMACGVPVITSDRSSIPETVGDAAIKINPDCTDELASEMIRVLSDESLRNALIGKGLTHIESHTWEKAATKMIKVFNEINTRGFCRTQKKWI
jgi:glycosyltransferase involved in cell wall biosynthesis